jgi:hypothetical protein
MGLKNSWIIVVPKNRSLRACKEIVENLIEDEGIKKFKILEIRGEDIPLFVNKLIKQRKRPIYIAPVRLCERTTTADVIYGFPLTEEQRRCMPDYNIWNNGRTAAEFLVRKLRLRV